MKIATELHRGWIVDASVAAKWYLRDERHLENADRILDRYRNGVEPVTAPGFLRYELTNALLRAVRDGRIDEEFAGRAARRFAGLNITQRTDPDERLSAAYELAYGMGISFYDALYVALAQELAIPVVTADVELHDRVGKFLSSVMTLLENVVS